MSARKEKIGKQAERERGLGVMRKEGVREE
jgi:hypothetical protein